MFQYVVVHAIEVAYQVASGRLDYPVNTTGLFGEEPLQTLLDERLIHFAESTSIAFESDRLLQKWMNENEEAIKKGKTDFLEELQQCLDWTFAIGASAGMDALDLKPERPSFF